VKGGSVRSSRSSDEDENDYVQHLEDELVDVTEQLLEAETTISKIVQFQQLEDELAKHTTSLESKSKRSGVKGGSVRSSRSSDEDENDYVQHLEDELVDVTEQLLEAETTISKIVQLVVVEDPKNCNRPKHPTIECNQYH